MPTYRWYLQRKGYELGNFIMATPALQAVYEATKVPLSVFFETIMLASLYRSAPFIHSLGHTLSGKSCLHLGRFKKRKRDQSDSEYLFDHLTEGLKYGKKMPHTFVPVVQPSFLGEKNGKKHVAVFHGCLGNKWLSRKQLPIETLDCILSMLIERDMVPVLLGSKTDRKKFWDNVRSAKHSSVKYCCGKLAITQSISLLADCDAFVSNDTGLYHAAGALHKKGLVLWKNTDMKKNMSPAKEITHFRNKDGRHEVYAEAIKAFLDVI